MSGDTNSRFPHLGKLSIAILENLVEPVLGEKAMEEIKSPVVQHELHESIIKALQNTEQRFVKEYPDATIRESIINLPLANLPSVIQAVQNFYARPTDTSLEQILYEQLRSNLSRFSSETIKAGVFTYVKILREELVNLSGDIREKLSTIANLNVQDTTARMATTLDRILVHLTAGNKVVDKIENPSDNILRRGLRERKDLEYLSKSVRNGEALYAEGKLPEDLIDLLYSARRAFDEIRQRHGQTTSKSRVGDLQSRKEAVEEIEKGIINGELFFYDATLATIVPIDIVLRDANDSYRRASEHTAQQEIDTVEKVLYNHPVHAAERLRRALQLPFCDEDKHRLEEKLAIADNLIKERERVSGFVEQELTLQEQEIVKLAVMNDWTPRKIANELHLNPTIVDIQITRICQKMQTHFGLEFANLTTLTTWLSGYWR
jgi:DNA-binding CsgD family transcriptional regulator